MRALLFLLLASIGCASPTEAANEEPLVVAKPVEAPPQPEEEPAEKVVVMPLTSKALDADVVGSLDRVLLTSLNDAGLSNVISPADIGSLLGVERLKDAAGCNDVYCAADFAGALDAQYVVYGIIDELGGRLNITLSMVDTRHAAVKFRSQVTVDKDERVFERAIDAVVARLLGDTNAPTSISAMPRTLPDPTPAPVVSETPPARLDESITGTIFVDIPGRAYVGNLRWNEQREIETRDAESALLHRWTLVGFEALDRVVIGEKPTLEKLRELGARYWILGEATGADNGNIMGTQMHSLRASVSARVIEVATGKVVATAKSSRSAGHMDAEAGIGLAMEKAGTECARELLDRLLADRIKK